MTVSAAGPILAVPVLLCYSFLKLRTQLSDVTIMTAILSQQLLVPCHENRLKSSGQEDYINETTQLMCEFQVGFTITWIKINQDKQ